MPDIDLVEVRVRDVSADALDAIRPLARRHGFKHTNADVIRFAVELACAVSSYVADSGHTQGFPAGFEWPRAANRAESRHGSNGRYQAFRRALGSMPGKTITFP